MKQRNLIISTLFFLFLAAMSAFAQSNLITSTSAGKVKLGMTVVEVRKAVAPMKLSRTSDGEGIALIRRHRTAAPARLRTRSRTRC